MRQAQLEAAAAWAYSSVVEHCVDIAGVASSILATPTIKNPAIPMGWRGFSMPFTYRQTPSIPLICPAKLGKLELIWANIGHENSGHWPFRGPTWHFGTLHPKTQISCSILTDGDSWTDELMVFWRCQIPGQRRHRGQGFRAKDDWLGDMARQISSVNIDVAGSARPVAASKPQQPNASSLLTPEDILARLSMRSAEPARWMRRIFRQYKIPHVRVAGQMRATEEQFQTLMEKVTCSPSVAVAKTALSIPGAQSRSATNQSSSKSSVQEQVTRMLHRT